MIVPYEEALQELWVSHRVDQHQREHRPNPDYSLFIAEFKTAMERIKADAWDHAIEHVSQLEADVGFMDHYKPHNPYREQEEA